MSALLEFERVDVVRGGTQVLVGVDAMVPDSGITAVVGASGSGKSTLLRCCNRLERPSAGRILYRGTDIATLDPQAHRRRVAMVFQAPTVFAGCALDNLRAGDPDLDPRRAGELMERVGLPGDLLSREADALSGGEAQRLCLARALSTRPDVILADEPTSALDAGAASTLESLARSLADGGVPIVWVTHDMAQVHRLADHVIELDGGRLTFAGSAVDHAGYRDTDQEEQ